MTEFISMKLKTDGKLKKLVKNLRNVEGKALGRTAAQVHRLLKLNTPVGKTNLLRKSVKLQKITPLHYIIFYTRDYWKYLNYGTGEHSPGGRGRIRSPSGGVMHWTDKDGNERFAYSTKGQPPQFMLEKTVKIAKPQINRWYNTYLTKEINNILRGAGGPETTIAEAP